MSNSFGTPPSGGPDFQAPTGWQVPGSQPHQYGYGRPVGGTPGGPHTPAPPPRRGGTPRWLAGVAIIAALALVLGLTGWWAARDQAAEVERARASASTAPPPARWSASSNEIAFTSAEGDGVLTIHNHSRESGKLVVNLTVASTAGNLSYAFSGFDATGRYIDSDYDSPEPSMATGYVDEGQAMTGNVSFVVPDGEFTLTMTNDAGESVTALRIA